MSIVVYKETANTYISAGVSQTNICIMLSPPSFFLRTYHGVGVLRAASAHRFEWEATCHDSHDDVQGSADVDLIREVSRSYVVRQSGRGRHTGTGVLVLAYLSYVSYCISKFKMRMCLRSHNGTHYTHDTIESD